MMRAYVHDDQLAEELAQDAFHRIYQKADKYEEGSNFAAWLRQIAANIAKSYLSRKQPMTLFALDGLPENFEKDERFDPANALHSDLLQEEMRNAIEMLPEQQRLPLVMYYFGCMSTKEISWAMKCPVGTVKSRVFYALKKIRKSLKDSGYDE